MKDYISLLTLLIISHSPAGHSPTFWLRIYGRQTLCPLCQLCARRDQNAGYKAHHGYTKDTKL